jgi:hypothetical protein
MWGDRHRDPERNGWAKLNRYFGPGFRRRVEQRRVIEIGSARGNEALAVADVAASVLGLVARYGRDADFIYSIDTVEHLAEPAAVFALMYDLLAPGGTACLSFARPARAPAATAPDSASPHCTRSRSAGRGCCTPSRSFFPAACTPNCARPSTSAG